MKVLLKRVKEAKLPEADIMQQLCHPRLLSIFGTTSDGVYHVIEHMEQGSLGDWMSRNSDKVTTEFLRMISLQVILSCLAHNCMS